MKSIFLAFLLTAASLSAADRVALVIGNNDYDDSGKLTDLRACRLDAQLIRRTLEAVGFTVLLGEDQDRAGMDDLLTRFESTIPKGGTAVVYFAGHAIEFDGKNYLLGTNAKLQARSRLTEEAMNAETFASAMLLAGAKSSFLLLDCCRNAPTDSDWLTRGATRKAGLAQIDVDGDIIIGYAAKPGAAALEPAEPGSNSPYATALAKWIPSGFKHGDVFEKVRQEVNETTGGLQRTWENGSFLEPYYFVSIGATPAPAPLPMIPVVAMPEPGTPTTATRDRPFENTLGMKFVPVVSYTNGKKVLFSVWETRVRDFAEFVRETGFDYDSGSIPGILDSDGWKEGEGFSWKNPGFIQTDEHPVTCVSREDAQAFCKWLSGQESKKYRLPTDHEWSLAVGIGDRESATASPRDKDRKIEGVFPWGTQWPPPMGAGNYAGIEAKTATWPANFSVIEGFRDDFARTSPAGSFSANKLGIFDLGGNVWEWCADPFGTLKSKTYYVLRGGSWLGTFDSASLLSSGRKGVGPSGRGSIHGFRVVLEVGSGG
jgi:hypothetical protein